MEFTFNVTVTIYDDDIDKMVKNVKKYKMNIKDAIYAVPVTMTILNIVVVITTIMN